MATEPNNTFLQATDLGTLTQPRIIRDSVSRADKFDFYSVRLAARSGFSALLRNLNRNADLSLYDSNRNRIALSNKPGTQADVISTVLEAGSYFVRVNSTGSQNNYRLRFATTAPPDLAGNTQAEARAITVGATPTVFKDAVSTADPNDFYQVTTTAFGNLNLNLTGLTADANVQILNSTGTVIRSAIASDATPESIGAGLQAGTYFIRVFPGASNATTNYDLTVGLTPLKLFGLGDNNSLVSFNVGDTANAKSVAITGLATGETLVGIDVRPASGQIFGVSSANRIYTLDSITGAATAVGTAPFSTTPLTGTSFGVDFNPVPDLIRLTSDAEENLRLNPNTGALAGTDTALNPPGNVVASAYTNNRAGATSTTLFGIDSVSDQLVRQGGLGGVPSPNGGLLTNVGPLGVDFGSSVGFDIFTDGTGVDFAFATSGTSLYSINLSTGAATSLGTVSISGVPVNLVGLAAKA
jgi:Domain of unknown function (DUF4394)/Bacterial pre-peptidase C-terminal domain